jgi:hypothetical protein
MFLTTLAGYVPVRSIELIEDPDDYGQHVVHYHLGAGSRQTVASSMAVNALLDRCADESK